MVFDTELSGTDVEVEYVSPELILDETTDPLNYEYFNSVFYKFSFERALDELAAAEALASKEELFPTYDMMTEYDNQEQEEPPLSKKKARKLNRMPLAELKSMVKRPEVVEWVDVTAPDPLLLVALKCIRNSVPVPQHWCQKRKYLLGKRGFDKPPFELPLYLKDLGITEQRSAVSAQDNSKSLKTKTRERLMPKMGKISLDYEKMHDAFFKHQTKPRMTKFGDLYYEGKEFETKITNVTPGIYSDELRAALGMTSAGSAPPWIVNMQRYGPPPSYPHLKIPGVNAPIPAGGQWGYQLGGWGKAPVDETGLWGCFWTNKGSESAGAPIIDRTYWGKLEIEGFPEFADQGYLSEGDQMEEEESSLGLERYDTDDSGYATPSGISSIASGIETPDYIELRKETKRSLDSEFVSEQKPLYSIISQKETSNIRTGMLASTHVYDLKGSGPVHVSIEDPSELDNIDQSSLHSKHTSTGGTASSRSSKIGKYSEDVSDMLVKQAERIEKKKKRSAEKKDFKF